MKTICSYFLAIALSFSLMSCGKLNLTNTTDSFSLSSINTGSQLSETAPPKLIRKLEQNLTSYKPQVAIVFPRQGTKLRETQTNVQLSVKDFPLFQDERLGLGLNLHLILDNEPYIPLYSLEEPITLENLTPGTHTLRVFACLPWHESLKTQGAYAETSFSVLTETEDNYPQSDIPLLTYNEPSGNYSAEPIMLDFYIKDPAKENLKSGDTIPNSVKVTVNDESFIVDQWHPIYLKGFKEGNNLVQLDLIDSGGNKIDNAFNSTVRLITYKPDLPDPLAKLVTNQISLEEAQAIIDPEYYDKLTQESEVESQAEAEAETKLKTKLKTEPKIETDTIPSVEESQVTEEQVTEETVEAIESNDSVVKEPELENVEKSKESASVTEPEINNSEFDDSQLLENSNSVNTEAIIETDVEAIKAKDSVVEEPALETVEDIEKSATATESEIIDSEFDDSQLLEDNNPVNT